MDYHTRDLSHNEFKELKELIGKEVGIQISDFKKLFLVSRLSPRLNQLRLQTFRDYLELFQDPDFKKEELGKLINRITTNETRFFRENQHFEYLRHVYLPSLVSENQVPKTISFWSAGCATGEEAYSLAMVLVDFCKDYPGLRPHLMATDIDSEALGKAQSGLFKEDAAQNIPPPFLKKFFLKGVKEWTGFIKARTVLKEVILFEHFNLHKPGTISRRFFDGIFCRNVLIYFLPGTRERVLEMFHQWLKPTGLLFLGHSEQLFDKGDFFQPLGNTIYQKVN